MRFRKLVRLLQQCPALDFWNGLRTGHGADLPVEGELDVVEAMFVCVRQQRDQFAPIFHAETQRQVDQDAVALKSTNVLVNRVEMPFSPTAVMERGAGGVKADLNAGNAEFHKHAKMFGAESIS